MTHLLGCEIEGALLGLRTSEVKFGLNFIGTELANHPLGATHTNQGLRNGLGADFKVGAERSEKR